MSSQLLVSFLPLTETLKMAEKNPINILPRSHLIACFRFIQQFIYLYHITSASDFLEYLSQIFFLLLKSPSLGLLQNCCVSSSWYMIKLFFAIHLVWHCHVRYWGVTLLMKCVSRCGSFESQCRVFRRGPAVKTPGFQCRGCRFDP